MFNLFKMTQCIIEMHTFYLVVEDIWNVEIIWMYEKKMDEILIYLELWIFFCLDQDYDLAATMLKLQFLIVWPCLQSPLVQ